MTKVGRDEGRVVKNVRRRIVSPQMRQWEERERESDSGERSWSRVRLDQHSTAQTVQRSTRVIQDFTLTSHSLPFFPYMGPDAGSEVEVA